MGQNRTGVIGLCNLFIKCYTNNNFAFVYYFKYYRIYKLEFLFTHGTSFWYCALRHCVSRVAEELLHLILSSFVGKPLGMSPCWNHWLLMIPLVLPSADSLIAGSQFYGGFSCCCISSTQLQAQPGQRRSLIHFLLTWHKRTHRARCFLNWF